MVADIIDKGAFGQVVKGVDLREKGREVALKLSRNKDFDVANAKDELRILQRLNHKDKGDEYRIVRILDNFHFRRHAVLVFELLGQNLFKYMRQPNFFGITSDQLKYITL